MVGTGDWDQGSLLRSIEQEERIWEIYKDKNKTLSSRINNQDIL